MKCVSPAAWFATVASAPRRRPISARAAIGKERRTAARKSLFTWASDSVLDRTTRALARPLFRPRLRGQFQHALHRPESAYAQIFRQPKLRGAVAHAEVDLLQRVEAHVGADAAIAPAAGRRGNQLGVGTRLG